VWRRGWATSQNKKIIFCPQHDIVWVHFDAVLNRQKTLTVTRSLGTQILRFNRERSLQNSAKLSQKSRPDYRGVTTGVYRYIYTPKISDRFVHVWDINTCFEIAITS